MGSLNVGQDECLIIDVLNFWPSHTSFEREKDNKHGGRSVKHLGFRRSLTMVVKKYAHTTSFGTNCHYWLPCKSGLLSEHLRFILKK